MDELLCFIVSNTLNDMMIAGFLAWIVGVVPQLQQAQLWPVWGYGCLLSVGILGVCGIVYGRRRNARFFHGRRYVLCRYALVCLFVSVAGFSWTGLQAAYRMAQALNPLYEQQDILVVGTVEELPQMQSGRWRFVFNVEQASWEEDGATQKIELPRRLLLSWYFRDGDLPSVPEIKTGQCWSFQVRVKAPHGALNLHTFDYELWLWSQQIGAVGYVRTAKNAPEPGLLDGGRSYSSMSQWREKVREQIMQTVEDSRQAGLIAALTLGDQRAISQEDWDTFRITGIAHLVSISGLHITMMAWIMYGFVGWFWRRSSKLMLRLPAHTAAMVAGLLCACLYAWFTGWGVPAQRTVMMLATVVLLRLVGIRWPWYVVWLFVAVVIVTIDPWALLQAGFWLSFVAVGVLFAQSSQAMQDKGEQALEKEIKRLQLMLPQPWWKKLLLGLWGKMRALLTVQLRISIALAPLTLLLFQQVSVVGLVVNMLAIPWVTFVMVPMALLGMVFHPLWHLAAWAGNLLLQGLDWFASLPFAVVYSAVPPLAIAVLAMLGSIVLVLPQFRWRYRCLGALLIIPVFIWQPKMPAQGEFEVVFLDVGQGSSVLIRTANHALLYDAGPKYGGESDAGSVLVVPALRALGVSLDKMVISHADADHAGGMVSVWESYPQAELMYSASDEAVFGKLLNPPTAYGQRQDCVAGAHWQWDDVDFEILHPFAVEDSGKNMSGNAQSCVLRVSTQSDVSRAVLLTGDIENEQERALAEKAQRSEIDIRADVLLMPHHGSKSSSSALFLNTVEPAWAVAQTGYLNRYGQPAPEVVERYQAQGVQVVNTASCGAAIWLSDQPAKMDCARQLRARYWRQRSGEAIMYNE